jgi:hypothetical protein
VTDTVGDATRTGRGRRRQVTRMGGEVVGGEYDGRGEGAVKRAGGEYDGRGEGAVKRAGGEDDGCGDGAVKRAGGEDDGCGDGGGGRSVAQRARRSGRRRG